jgi:hypothetical protein
MTLHPLAAPGRTGRLTGRLNGQTARQTQLQRRLMSACRLEGSLSEVQLVLLVLLALLVRLAPLMPPLRPGGSSRLHRQPVLSAASRRTPTNNPFCCRACVAALYAPCKPVLAFLSLLALVLPALLAARSSQGL